MSDVQESLGAIAQTLGEEFAGYTIEQFQSSEDKRRESVTFEVANDRHRYLFTFTHEFLHDVAANPRAETVKSLRREVDGCADAQILVRSHGPLEFISRSEE